MKPSNIRWIPPALGLLLGACAMDAEQGGDEPGLATDNKADSWAATTDECHVCQDALVGCFTSRSYEAHPGCHDELSLCVEGLEAPCEAPPTGGLFECIDRMAGYGLCLEGHHDGDQPYIEPADKPACLEAFVDGLDALIDPSLCALPSDDDVLACFACRDAHWDCARRDLGDCDWNFMQCAMDSGLGRTCHEP